MSFRIQGFNKPLAEQIEALREILARSELVSTVLSRAAELTLPNWYLGAGGITQTVWNYLLGNKLDHGIKDFDLVYFDPGDITWEGEDKAIQKAKKLFNDFPYEVEVKNQARVHLWYESKFGKKLDPYKSTEDAISTWPTTATSIGVRKTGVKDLLVCAPFGLNDLFGMIVRPNKAKISRDIYERKVERWIKFWPTLEVISWDN